MHLHYTKVYINKDKRVLSIIRNCPQPTAVIISKASPEKPLHDPRDNEPWYAINIRVYEPALARVGL